MYGHILTHLPTSAAPSSYLIQEHIMGWGVAALPRIQKELCSPVPAQKERK